MFLVLIKFLRTAFPFLKECFFGKQPIPEIIYKHRITGFFVFSTIFFIAVGVLFLDMTTTLSGERDKYRDALKDKERELVTINRELEDTKKQLDPTFYQRIIDRLEAEVKRLDAENARYRLLLTSCNTPTVGSVDLSFLQEKQIP